MTLDERAQNARDMLFERYDVLNAHWLQVEEQLTAFHIPRSVSYAYKKYPDPDGAEGGMIHKRLGLRKIRGKWRICYCLYYYDAFPDMEDWTPITECSAEIRVEAARHVEGLREAIVKSAESFISRVDKAISSLATAVGLPTSTESQGSLADRAKLNGQHQQ